MTCTAVFEAFDFLMPLVAASMPCLVQAAHGLAYAPELGIVGVRLEAAFVGRGQHLVVDTRGVADAQHVDATVDKFFAYPVDGLVALCAYHDLAFASQGLVDGLDQCRGLACARRPVDYGHVAGRQHLVYSSLLRGIEIGESHGRERQFAEGPVGIDVVAQFAEASFCRGKDVERFKHHAVGSLVERQHDPCPSAVGVEK